MSILLVPTVCTAVIEIYAIYLCPAVSIWIEWGIVWIFCPRPVKLYFYCIVNVFVVVVIGMIFPEMFVMMLTRFDISFVNHVIVTSFLVSYFANSVFIAKRVLTWDLSLDIISTRSSIAASNILVCASDSIAKFAPNPAFSAVNLFMSSCSWNLSVQYVLNTTEVFCAWVLRYQIRYASAYSPLRPIVVCPALRS